MKRLALLFFLVVTAALAWAYAPPTGWQWLDGVRLWAERNPGFIGLLSLVAACALGLLTLLAQYLFERAKRAGRPAHDPERTKLEHNYLRQLADWFEELQRHPLNPDETEILELRAELVVEPKFKIVEIAAERRQGDEGKITSDLVRTLLRASVPVVVLGEPGAGKSVSLRKVMLELARAGLAQKSPMLPIYVRLGLFTRPLTGASGEAVEFVKENLRGLEGHAELIAADFDRYLREGRFVFLLDAMDEMPRDYIQERFAALSLLRRYTPNKILFACRKLDFPETFPFLRAYIQPFDRGQVRRFLRRVLRGDLGKRAAKEVLAPANPLRDMASNPFFLKLISIFYQEQRRLPDSRAELMQIYEAQVFERASGRTTFPAGLDLETFRAVLARLAYLITISRRGVTIPVEDFRERFVPAAAAGDEARLAGLSARVGEVLEVAARERLLRVEAEQPAGAAPPGQLVSFFHHRLQEYYTAAYLEEFGSRFEWEENLDDIWWQETLIMLFGITKRPAERMSGLLEHLPEKPVLCPAFGRALSNVLKQSSAMLRPALRDLLALDPANFYGLREAAQVEPAERSAVLDALRERGLLDPGRNPSASEVLVLSRLSAEPDDNSFNERVRQWLEDRNAVLLDRLGLGVECYRNSLSKLGRDGAALAPRDRFVAALSAFSREGNLWETVRAIQIAQRLPGIDLYAVVEPALNYKDAWCRREAMTAVAKYPFAADARRGHTGFILFLQFMRGELLATLPQFARAVLEKPRLAWFIPGVLLLAAVTVGAALSPLAIYPVLAARYAPAPGDLGGMLGLGRPVWLLALGGVLTLLVYLARLRWGMPLLRTTLLVCAVAVSLPYVFGGMGGGEQPAEPERPWRFNLIQPEAVERALGRMATMTLGPLKGLAFLATPQLAEVFGLSALALAACILLGSARIAKAPLLYTRDLNAFSTYTETGQVIAGGALLLFLAIILLCLLFVGILYFLPFLTYLISLLLWAYFAALALGALVGLYMVVTNVGRWLREVQLRRLPLPRLGWVGRALLVLAGAGLLIKGFFVLRDSGRLGLVLLLAALLVVGYFAARILKPACLSAVDLGVVLLRRVVKPRVAPGRGVMPVTLRPERETKLLAHLDLVSRQGGLTSEEHYRIYRESLGRVKAGWLRAWFYQEMAKRYKEMRQERARKDGRDGAP